MTAYLLTDHLLNFIAPAAVVALLLVWLGRFFSPFLVSKKPKAPSMWVNMLIVFLVNLVVLATGLVVFGHDGKMATYAAMMLAAAVCQWVLLKAWKG